MDRWGHFIDGREEGSDEGGYLNAFNPRVGEATAEVAKGDEGDVNRAVEAAMRAFPEWRDRKPIERGRILLDIARKLRERTGEFARLESQETGKPEWQAPLEIEGAAAYFEFYGGLANLYQG